MSSSTKRPLSAFAHAVLALIGRKPRSGYDLTRVFAETPLSQFSESPGAIYPALQRLEHAELIRGRLEDTHSLRPRRVFQITARGRGALEAWLRAPIDPSEVRRRPGVLALRFSFMDQYIEPHAIREFLRNYIAENKAMRAELIEHRDAVEGKISQTGSLAIEMGVSEVDARIRWAKKALERIEQLPAPAS